MLACSFYEWICTSSAGLVESLRNLFAKRAPAPLMRWVQHLEEYLQNSIHPSLYIMILYSSIHIEDTIIHTKQWPQLEVTLSQGVLIWVQFQVQHDAIPQVSKDFFFRFLLRLLIGNHGNNVDKQQLSGTLRTNPGIRNMVSLNDDTPEGKVNCSFVSLKTWWQQVKLQSNSCWLYLGDWVNPK